MYWTCRIATNPATRRRIAAIPARINPFFPKGFLSFLGGFGFFSFLGGGASVLLAGTTSCSGTISAEPPSRRDGSAGFGLKSVSGICFGSAKRSTDGSGESESTPSCEGGMGGELFSVSASTGTAVSGITSSAFPSGSTSAGLFFFLRKKEKMLFFSFGGMGTATGISVALSGAGASGSGDSLLIYRASSSGSFTRHFPSVKGDGPAGSSS